MEDETGEEVGEHIARITEKALRGGSSKKDEEKLQDLKQKHKRPMNINNLQVPKVEEMLWRQLSRSTKHSDFMQQVAVANFGQAMVPIIKALELMQSRKDPERMQTYMMDAFKTLSLLIKTTNTARLERVKKELNPRYREVCQEGPSATKLLGDNFHETVKKLDQAKGNLTVQMAQHVVPQTKYVIPQVPTEPTLPATVQQVSTIQISHQPPKQGTYNLQKEESSIQKEINSVGKILVNTDRQNNADMYKSFCLKNTPENFIAGKTQLFKTNWAKITKDK